MVQLIEDKIEWDYAPALDDSVIEFFKRDYEKDSFYWFINKPILPEINANIQTLYMSLGITYDEWIDTYLADLKLRYSLGFHFRYESSDTKYLMFKITSDGVFGLHHYEDNVQWKRLNFYKFLTNRGIDSKIAEKAVEEFKKIALDYNSLQVEELSLIEGYDDTEVESCMRGRGDYFTLLNACGKLLSFKYNDIKGRAILWNKALIEGLPEGSEGLLDRIYPSNNHSFIEIIKKWAWNKNYYTKLEQNFSNKEEFEFDNKIHTLDLKLTIPRAIEEEDSMPYMDTFAFYNEGDTYINNTEGEVTFDSTEGRGLGVHCCSICGCQMRIDESFYVDGVGDVCVSCIDGYRWCEDVDRYVFIDDCFYNETEGCYYGSDRHLVFIDGRGYFSDDDSDIFYCSHCGEHYHILDRDCTEAYEGTICDICRDSYYEYCEDTETYHREETTYYSELLGCYYYYAYIKIEQEKEEERKANKDETKSA